VRILIPLLMLLLTGCLTNAEFTPVPGADSNRRYEGEVEVLTAFPARGTYENLGIVIVRGVRRSDKEDLIERVKAEAARRGADAVVLQGDVKSRRGASGAEEKSLGAYALKLKR
ncbi:MAG: hypothetical protein R3174_13300, partial [Gammaproteobacteria bacterium]|nr:hypothetical protein [Gammaproteobacteria bacterium]